MKLLYALVIAFYSLTLPVQAHDDQLVDDILSTISHFAHYHHHHDDEDEGYEGQENQHNLGPKIVAYLGHLGHPDSLVVGSRDRDCGQSRSFVGGWGVVFKGSDNKPISGVVCVDAEAGPHLFLDR